MDCNYKSSTGHIASCLTVLCCFGLSFLSGCSETSTVDVKGKVAFQGKPIKSGVICFIPEGGKGDTITADIKEGQYAVKLSRGQKRVEISSIRVVGQKQVRLAGELQAADVKKEMIPVQYNQQSKLRADICNEELNFDLQ